jgi:hypothetical protein
MRYQSLIFAAITVLSFGGLSATWGASPSGAGHERALIARIKSTPQTGRQDDEKLAAIVEAGKEKHPSQELIDALVDATSFIPKSSRKYDLDPMMAPKYALDPAEQVLLEFHTGMIITPVIEKIPAEEWRPFRLRLVVLMLELPIEERRKSVEALTLAAREAKDPQRKARLEEALRNFHRGLGAMHFDL